MLLTIEDAKAFLRVDSSDEDHTVIRPIVDASQQLVVDILRSNKTYEELEENPLVTAATYHAIAYLYEHREDADMNALTLQLRSLLQAERKAVF